MEEQRFENVRNGDKIPLSCRGRLPAQDEVTLSLFKFFHGRVHNLTKTQSSLLQSKSSTTSNIHSHFDHDEIPTFWSFPFDSFCIGT